MTSECMRLFNKIERARNKHCWRWIGAKIPCGYGQLRIGKTRVLAHRAAYALFNGAIPRGFEIDHICENKWCVNPAHLQAVTPGQNCQLYQDRREHKCRHGVLRPLGTCVKCAVLFKRRHNNVNKKYRAKQRAIKSA